MESNPRGKNSMTTTFIYVALLRPHSNYEQTRYGLLQQNKARFITKLMKIT